MSTPRKKREKKPAAERLEEGVRFLERTARTLTTIGETDRIWTDKDPVLDVEAGSIVRVAPPPDAPRELVERVLMALRGRAAAVKCLPQQRQGTGGAAASEAPIAAGLTPRAACLQMVDEVVVPDEVRPELRRYVEEVLAEVKL
jgi:hypothetical protein